MTEKNPIQWWKKAKKGSGYALFLLVSTLALLETAYRFYLFDFYRPELLGLNNQAELAAKPDTCKTVLVFGDSFSAYPESWVAVLRKNFPGKRIVNTSISGTCPREAARMAATRTQEFKPQVVVFQLFMGNDLLDLRHPIAWEKLPFARNFYWLLADRIHFFGFLNYRLAHLKPAPNGAAASPKMIQPFSPERYNEREKTCLLAEPSLLENTALLRGGHEKDFKTLCDWLDEAVSEIPDSCQILILPIPSCFQVNDFYRQNLLRVGATNFSGEAIFQESPPFVQDLRQKFENQNRKIAVLNPLGILQKTDCPELRLYLENDPHFSPAGANLIGDWMVGNFKNLKLD